jgi:hypothetical protein
MSRLYRLSIVVTAKAGRQNVRDHTQVNTAVIKESYEMTHRSLSGSERPSDGLDRA